MKFGITEEKFKQYREELLADESGWIHRISKKYLKMKIIPLLQEFYISEENTAAEIIFRIRNNIFKNPICPVCKINEVLFRGISKGYQETCSISCSRPASQLKTEETNQIRYGCKNVYQNSDIKDRIAKTNTEKFGFASASKNEGVKKKGVETCQLRYGTDNAMSSGSSVREEVEERNMIKFGVKDAWNSIESREKAKAKTFLRFGVECILQAGSPFLPIIEATNVARYGSKNPMGNKEVSQRSLKTNIERHGGTGFGSPSIAFIIEQTNLERRGVKNVGSDPEVIEQVHQTYFDIWGVRHFRQSTKYWEDYSKTDSFKKTHKPFVMPSGKVIHIQGFENVVLDILLLSYNENDILNSKDEVPEIWYFLDTDRRYYPDIFIPKGNLIIEVKSQYTYDDSLDQNLLKAQACKDAGFNYQFWICDKTKLLEIIDY